MAPIANVAELSLNHVASIRRGGNAQGLDGAMEVESRGNGSRNLMNVEIA
jgi:hypothetical protein